MVKRTDGDIYKQDTLQKAWDLTRGVDLTPDIDQVQLISISTEKLRYVEATPECVDVRPLMGDRVPGACLRTLKKWRTSSGVWRNLPMPATSTCRVTVRRP
ncbi:MAG: hypothetical protein ACT4PG_09195 [Panacagrimonas sp.]